MTRDLVHQGLNFFGGKPVLEEEESEADAASQQDRIVFAANLWLDQPQTLARLRTLLSGNRSLLLFPSCGGALWLLAR